MIRATDVSSKYVAIIHCTTASHSVGHLFLNNDSAQDQGYTNSSILLITKEVCNTEYEVAVTDSAGKQFHNEIDWNERMLLRICACIRYIKQYRMISARCTRVRQQM